MISSVYLDANILIANYFRSHPDHQPANDLLGYLTKGNISLGISALTLDEFWYGIIFILRANDASLFKKTFLYFASDIKKATHKLSRLLNVKIINVDFDRAKVLTTLDYIKRFNLKPRDAFHLIYCRENKIKYLVSLDEDFQKLKVPWLQVITKTTDIDR